MTRCAFIFDEINFVRKWNVIPTKMNIKESISCELWRLWQIAHICFVFIVVTRQRHFYLSKMSPPDHNRLIDLILLLLLCGPTIQRIFRIWWVTSLNVIFQTFYSVKNANACIPEWISNAFRRNSNWMNAHFNVIEWK